jgi:hypothetical protein
MSVYGVRPEIFRNAQSDAIDPEETSREGR